MDSARPAFDCEPQAPGDAGRRVRVDHLVVDGRRQHRAEHREDQ